MMTATTMARAETLAVRLPAEEWERLDRIKAHFAEKYPGVPMTNATAIKIALALVERVELGAPTPPASKPASQPRVKAAAKAPPKKR